MRPITSRRLVVGVGTAAITLAVALLVRALLGGPVPSPSVQLAVGLAVLVGLVAAGWQVRARPAVDDPGERSPYLRGGQYRLVAGQPEETDVDAPLAGGELATRFAAAAEAAREAGRVDAGLAVARPPLRETVRAMLVAGGSSPAAADRAIETGSWTTDTETAALIAPELSPPPRPFRTRLRAWLRPGRVVNERLSRAVGVIDRTAAETLPAVVGHDAPRRVTITPPPIATLERAVDGTLRSARPRHTDPVPASDSPEPEEGPEAS